LLFARCAGFIERAPGFSYPGVPRPLRAGLALLLTLAMLPSLRRHDDVVGFALVPALALEFLIGSVAGFGACVLYDGAYAGGRAIDDYVGVKAIAPNLHLVAPSGFGRVWSLAFTGSFFLLGAYRPVVMAFAQTLHRIPLGGQFPGGTRLLEIPATLFQVAIEVAGPAIGAGFVAQIALAALSRTIPRFGSLTLSFPVVFGVALIATALSVAALAPHAAPILILP
jgi:flagellar biosynthetic protein FliR